MYHLSQLVHFGKDKRLTLCDSEHFFSFLVVEELALLVEQLECVPLLWVMTGGEDNSSSCFFAYNSQLGGRSGGESYIDYIISHSH